MIPNLFPQMGNHKKHEREIRLVSWQMEHLHTRALIRGLIHSDGSRYVNRILNKKSGKIYEYPSYMFTNTSSDIVQITYDTLERIGVRVRRKQRKSVEDLSVYRREDVKLLDSFGCMKA
jgi:hypothetical protein